MGAVSRSRATGRALAGKEGGRVSSAGRGGRVVAGAPSLGDAGMGARLAGRRPVQRRRFAHTLQQIATQFVVTSTRRRRYRRQSGSACHHTVACARSSGFPSTMPSASSSRRTARRNRSTVRRCGSGRAMSPKGTGRISRSVGSNASRGAFCRFTRRPQTLVCRGGQRSDALAPRDQRGRRAGGLTPATPHFQGSSARS